MNSLRALATVLALCGCVPIPAFYGTSRVGHETTNAIIPGTSTRADVLLALGAPDESDWDDSRFAWYWTENWAWMAWSVGPGTGGMFPAYGGYCFDVALDERGVVARAEVIGRGLYGGSEQCLDDWSAETSRATNAR